MMKKLIALTLALVLALSLLTACDGISLPSLDRSGASDSSDSPPNQDRSASSDSSDSSGRPDNSDDDDGKIDVEKAAERILDDAIENNSFSVAAADAAMKQRGVSVDLFAPDWDWNIDEEKMHAYGDTGSYGHGVVRYTKTTEGYLTGDEYREWVAKAFMATAEISDNGFNIQGFDWGEGIVPKTIDEVFDGFLQTWSYVYDETIMNVYVEIAEEKASELEGEPYWDADKGEYVWPEWTHYYIGYQIDVGTGSQGEWDWDELERVFEEYEDEIKDALTGS